MCLIPFSSMLYGGLLHQLTTVLQYKGFVYRNCFQAAVNCCMKFPWKQEFWVEPRINDRQKRVAFDCKCFEGCVCVCGGSFLRLLTFWLTPVHVPLTAACSKIIKKWSFFLTFFTAVYLFQQECTPPLGLGLLMFALASVELHCQLPSPVAVLLCDILPPAPESAKFQHLELNYSNTSKLWGALAVTWQKHWNW